MQPVVEQSEPIKPEIGLIPHLIGKLFYAISGWKLAGRVPNVPKAVLIGAPHTSNYDGLVTLMTSWVARRRIGWLIKAEWLRPPFGWVLSRLGAIGIDRQQGFGFVEDAVQRFEQSETLFMAIAPEGTRRKSDHWKTGFYWIALQADVPIFLLAFNYEKKELQILTPALKLSGDIKADMEEIWAHYEGIQGRFPDRVSDRRLRPGSSRPPRSISFGGEEQPQ
ncbi:MAG: lysophospholipid acyltransferase family protein [Anaerolineae bacterium]